MQDVNRVHFHLAVISRAVHSTELRKIRTCRSARETRGMPNKSPEPFQPSTPKPPKILNAKPLGYNLLPRPKTQNPNPKPKPYNPKPYLQWTHSVHCSPLLRSPSRILNGQLVVRKMELQWRPLNLEPLTLNLKLPNPTFMQGYYKVHYRVYNDKSLQKK